MIGYSVKDGRLVDRENDVLEFKSALKGIPSSMWETYSAFANCFGGTIILGVQDSTGVIEGVPNAELRVQDIWNTLNNPQVVSVNILCTDDIKIAECDGKQIIVVSVPRADRHVRPVYYKRLESGTFKRNGEGDYHCTMPEIASMFRDQTDSSYDSTVIDGTSYSDLDPDSIRAFRNEMNAVHPDHIWNAAGEIDFMKKIGAVCRSNDNLTVAGLLMFGREEAIYSYFPRYKLDYMECPMQNTAWTYRRVTGDGLWVGNVYNFFSSVRGRIGADVDQPLEIDDDMHRIMCNDVHKAVRECLLNSLVHADYLSNLVVKIEKYPKRIVIKNSGLFRIPLERAENGGESDPRNAVMSKMFSLIGLTEQAGVGVNFVFGTWKRNFGVCPIVVEDIDTLRTSIELDLLKSTGIADLDERILGVIRGDPGSSMEAIAVELGVSRPSVANHIKILKSKGILRRVGGTRGHWEIN